MEQSLISRILAKVLVAIFIIAVLDLIYINWWIVKKEKINDSNKSTDNTRIIESDVASPEPSTLIIASPVPPSNDEINSKTVETKTIVEKQTTTIVQNAQKEIFIPIGSGSSNSGSFSDINGLEVNIDTNKYSGVESIVFEASLWVEGGNGRGYAQITNVTDKNPLIESQISSSSPIGVLKTSGNIPMPDGSRMYRVQAKTDITNFATKVDNARIKITLK